MEIFSHYTSVPIQPVAPIKGPNYQKSPFDQEEVLSSPSKNNDTVEISTEAKDAFQNILSKLKDPSKSDNANNVRNDQDIKNKSGETLSEEDVKEVEKLKKRNQEVIRHEQAHLAALGAYKTGGASYEYETGPDGNRYAIAGEVQADLSPENSAQASIQKFQAIQRSAMAPDNPSSADHAVANEAKVLEQQARKELLQESKEDSLEKSQDNKSSIAKQNKIIESYQPKSKISTISLSV